MLLSSVVALVLAAQAVAEPLTDMIEKRTKLKTHSLYAPFIDSDLQNRWDFGGDAIINTGKHVRLTQDRQSQSGWLWSRMPMSVANWQVDFEFKVDGSSPTMYGDGFAMWVTRDRATPGPVFGNQDQFTGLGIFFDTYANSRHSFSFPRVTAMLGDGRTPYDHDGDNVAHELAACSMNFRKRNVATKARLTHIRGKGIQLELHLEEWDQWKTCFQIEAELPEAPFIGFSGMTGDVSENHDIVAVSSYSALLHPQYRSVPQQAVLRETKKSAKFDVSGNRPPKKRGSSGGAAGWFLFLLKMIGVLAFVAFAVAAYRTYAAQQNKRPSYY